MRTEISRSGTHPDVNLVIDRSTPLEKFPVPRARGHVERARQEKGADVWVELKYICQQGWEPDVEALRRRCAKGGQVSVPSGRESAQETNQMAVAIFPNARADEPLVEVGRQSGYN